MTRANYPSFSIVSTYVLTWSEPPLTRCHSCLRWFCCWPPRSSRSSQHYTWCKFAGGTGSSALCRQPCCGHRLCPRTGCCRLWNTGGFYLLLSPLETGSHFFYGSQKLSHTLPEKSKYCEFIMKLNIEKGMCTCITLEVCLQFAWFAWYKKMIIRKNMHTGVI